MDKGPVTVETPCNTRQRFQQDSLLDTQEQLALQYCTSITFLNQFGPLPTHGLMRWLFWIQLWNPDVDMDGHHALRSFEGHPDF